MKCAICGKEITGWGNNPWPIRKNEEARCCDECNSKYVIMGRLSMINRTHEQIAELADMFDKSSVKQLDALFS